jgi:predicted secreted protein
MDIPVFRESDSGRTVDVAVGAGICIELNENPATGYTWNMPELDGQVLSLETDETVPFPGAGIGGGGVRRFLLRARKPGTARLRLAYRRSWETDVPPDARFELTVNVS